jgi:hypothetical protein
MCRRMAENRMRDVVKKQAKYTLIHTLIMLVALNMATVTVTELDSFSIATQQITSRISSICKRKYVSSNRINICFLA